METVTVNMDGETCSVKSPYNSDFVARARNLSGKFDRGLTVWKFPASQEQRVRDLCREIYGTDGNTDIPTITLRLTLKDADRWAAGSEIELCGRRIAVAFGRDSGARIAENVVVLSGGFGSGGSRKNYRVTVEDGTEIELLEVPRPAAERLLSELEENKWILSARIVEPEKIDRDALIRERAQIIARLEEINGLLK